MVFKLSAVVSCVRKGQTELSKDRLPCWICFRRLIPVAFALQCDWSVMPSCGVDGGVNNTLKIRLIKNCPPYGACRHHPRVSGLRVWIRNARAVTRAGVVAVFLTSSVYLNFAVHHGIGLQRAACGRCFIISSWVCFCQVTGCGSICP